MATPTSKAQTCAIKECFNSGTNSCGRCNIVYYCSKSCQVMHWPEHKEGCYEANLDRTVQRAGSLLQDIFYLFAEKAFAAKVSKIARNNNRLLVTYEDTRDYQTFPHHRVQSKQEKQMLLALVVGSPRVTLGMFYDILCQLLKNTPIQIEEIVAHLKKPSMYAEAAINCIYSALEGRTYKSFDKHNLIRIKAKNSPQNWYLDTFGARWGIFSGCSDSQTYLTCFANRIDVVAPGGTCNKLYNALVQLRIEGSLKNKMQFEATRQILHAMEDFKKETRIAIPDLLRSPDDTYPTRKRRLLELISSSLEEFVANADSANDFSAVESQGVAEGFEHLRMFVSAMRDHERYVKQFAV